MKILDIIKDDTLNLFIILIMQVFYMKKTEYFMDMIYTMKYSLNTSYTSDGHGGSAIKWMLR